MELRITRGTADKLGLKALAPFGLDPDGWRHYAGLKETRSIDLRKLSAPKIVQLDDLLAARAEIRGTKILRKDIAIWRAAAKDESGGTPRTLRQFSTLLTNYLLKVPGHRVYQRVGDEIHRTEDQPLWLACYVAKVEYHKAYEYSGTHHPARVDMDLRYNTFEKTEGETEQFKDDNIGGSVSAILAERGYYPETPALRLEYLATLEKYTAVVPTIGTQYLAQGFADDSPDGNPDSRESYYWSRTNTIQLTRNGEPSRVILDVFHEKEDDRHRNEPNRYDYFWANVATPDVDTDVDEDLDEEEITDRLDENNSERTPIEIPIHPWVVVFDTLKHLRLRIHVGQLTRYEYDTSLADKLVLSDERKQLVRLLIESKAGGFRDIVKGKSGGMVVLLAGPPGVGKTLTAEVYAESEQRPLYSVQCSQLGIDPDNLEDELLKVFDRARRWNAIMLLDEADVYVHQRGNDLVQNAIVGVFLRVLEYQPNVLFLTTNRPDDVDDAIASRCVARLNYAQPTASEQFRIWSILAAGTGVQMKKSDVEGIVKDNPGITGRDVKQLLKLARLMCEPGSQLVTRSMVEFVKQFRPTGS